MTFTNKDDAIKIKKLLGMRGDNSLVDEINNVEKYYNVSDVLIALMHFCDYRLELNPDDDFNFDFESHLISAREGYEENKKEEKV